MEREVLNQLLLLYTKARRSLIYTFVIFIVLFAGHFYLSEWIMVEMVGFAFISLISIREVNVYLASKEKSSKVSSHFFKVSYLILGVLRFFSMYLPDAVADVIPSFTIVFLIMAIMTSASLILVAKGATRGN